MPSPEATFWLAPSGAGVSTVALLWNILRDVFDRRSRVRVTAAVVNIIGKGCQDPTDYANFCVTNLATTDVHMLQVGAFNGRYERWSKFRKQGDWSVIIVPGLPRRLEPAPRADLLIELKPDHATQLERIRKLYTLDSRGNATTLVAQIFESLSSS